MPARKREYDEALQIAPWVDDIDNSCLRETVTEALVARRAAVRAKGDDKIIAVGDKTLERIEFGKDTGDLACRKAATAIRKFDEAYMGTRRGHALKKRYGRTKAKKKGAK